MIVITVAISDNLMFTDNATEVLNDAIIGFIENLHDEDFVCVNLGNNRKIMTNDA